MLQCYLWLAAGAQRLVGQALVSISHACSSHYRSSRGQRYTAMEVSPAVWKLNTNPLPNLNRFPGSIVYLEFVYRSWTSLYKAFALKVHIVGDFHFSPWNADLCEVE